MRTLLPAVLIFLGACASPRSTAIQVAVASDLAADRLAQGWSAATEAKIEICRATLPENSTPDDRRVCLGLFSPENTDRVIDAVEALVAVQKLVKQAAECEELRMCAESLDWAQVARDIKVLWSDLLPYVRALQEAK